MKSSYRIRGTSFIVNGREYSLGFRILTLGNFGKWVEPCFRSITSSPFFVGLQSNKSISSLHHRHAFIVRKGSHTHTLGQEKKEKCISATKDRCELFELVDNYISKEIAVALHVHVLHAECDQIVLYQYVEFDRHREVKVVEGTSYHVVQQYY